MIFYQQIDGRDSYPVESVVDELKSNIPTNGFD